VAVVGAGTVGGGVIEFLRRNADLLAANAGQEIALTHVCELNEEALKEFDLTDVTVTQDASSLFTDPSVDVLCELIGGVGAAKTLTIEALKAGKHVVTANKMLLACHGPELTEAAQTGGVELRYEAAVAGGIPIIKALREGLAANRIEHAYGILNGTCNYILSRMTYEGLAFDDVLKQAMTLGFAETPPDLDIEGHDTAHKCQILASLCYSSKVDLEAISVEGITGITAADVEYAREMGYLIKLLAVVRLVDGEIDARVHPALVPETHLLASVRNEFNAIYVQGDMTDATLYYGKGAGRRPTASAVIADIVDIARAGDGPSPPPFRYLSDRPLRDPGLLEGRYYLRLTTRDVPGVFGVVGSVLGHHGVSIASCFQKDPHGGGRVRVIIMTHESREDALRAALTEIDDQEFCMEPTAALRVIEE
jgi:homoserine dehydrogenase